MTDLINLLLSLQYFADGGGVNVNATTTLTNAYTGDTTDRSTDKDDPDYMAGELKDFYDTELLENARVELYYAQFGKRQALPKNHKGTVEWRKWNTFPRADKLQEAVIPTGKTFGMTSLTGSIDQYGMYTAISDKLELRAYDDVILGATEEMGASAAETQEALIRNALLAGENVLYCDNIDPLACEIRRQDPGSCREDDQRLHSQTEHGHQLRRDRRPVQPRRYHGSRGQRRPAAVRRYQHQGGHEGRLLDVPRR